jgi:hypothetical protein
VMPRSQAMLLDTFPAAPQLPVAKGSPCECERRAAAKPVPSWPAVPGLAPWPPSEELAHGHMCTALLPSRAYTGRVQKNSGHATSSPSCGRSWALISTAWDLRLGLDR